jgi:hypothetical protein
MEQPNTGKGRIIIVMKAKQESALAVRCPTCGAGPGEQCELNSGSPRTDPHEERGLSVSVK